ncbi:AAA family ATPase [Candidatus Micrarchaeota archaeon]|nr:AAA family ATPase [Candidatus Micrarchaeota archaeon]
MKKKKSKIDFSKIKEKIKNATKPEKTKTNVDAVSSGVPGLDEALGGGIPKNSFVLLSGSAGAGKSTLAMQFLLNGYESGEKTVYVSLEEDPAKLIKDFKNFNWPIQKAIDEKKLMIVKPAIYKFEPLLESIKNVVERNNATRLVIDSSSLLSMYFEKAYEVRRGLAELDRNIKRLGVTTFAISEIMEGSKWLSTTGVEEFIADGVIILHITKNENEYTRALSVRKMRSAKHSLKIMPMQINKEGIVVYPEEEVFSQV